MIRPDEITSDEACRRLECNRPQLHSHILAGRLSPRHEAYGKRTRVWYLASEVDALAKSWTPQKRRRAKKINFDAVVTNERGRLAGRVIPLIGKKSFKEICAECNADPVVVQQIFEALAQGIDGRIKARARQEQVEKERREERERLRDERTEKHRKHLERLKLLERKKAG